MLMLDPKEDFVNLLEEADMVGKVACVGEVTNRDNIIGVLNIAFEGIRRGSFEPEVAVAALETEEVAWVCVGAEACFEVCFFLGARVGAVGKLLQEF